MSDYYKPTFFSKRQKQLAWTNTITSIHDLLCNCEKPLQHTIQNILETEPSLKEDKNFKINTEKCLTTDGDGDTPEGDAGDIGLEDLEALFATEDTAETTG